MYKITLHDGTILDNLTLNGNNYISETILDDTVFEDNLKTVTIENGAARETYEDMVLVANRVFGGNSWFILGEKTQQQKKEEVYEARIIELEEALDMILNGVTE